MYKCKACHYVFGTLSRLTYHMDEFHAEPEPTLPPLKGR